MVLRVRRLRGARGRAVARPAKVAVRDEHEPRELVPQADPRRRAEPRLAVVAVPWRSASSPAPGPCSTSASTGTTRFATRRSTSATATRSRRPGAVPRLPARVSAGRAAGVRDPVDAALAGRRPERVRDGFEARDARLRGAHARVHALDPARVSRPVRSCRRRARLRRARARSCSARSFLSRFDLWPAALTRARWPRSSRGAIASAPGCSAWRWRRSSSRPCSSRSRRSGSGGGGAGARRSSASACSPWRWRSASSPSSPSRRTGSGTASPPRRTGRSRSRRSARASSWSPTSSGGSGSTMRSSHGSQNLAGEAPMRWPRSRRPSRQRR